jgi:hypothetical protein
MYDITTKTILVLLGPQTVTANADGPAASVAGLEGNIELIVTAGTPDSETGTLSLQIQTSPDGETDWEPVGPVLAAYSTAGGIVTANLNPVGCSAFIRVAATVGGTAPSFFVTALGIGTPQYSPVMAPA